MLERVREVAGSGALEDLTDLDLSNDLQVDQIAGALLKRLHEADDADAFRLLVELTSDRLAVMAEGLAAELGLATNPYELVIAFFSRLFIDLDPRQEAPPHFLANASDRLREDTETAIRDLALSDVHEPDSATMCEDGRTEADTDTNELIARATRIGFHRLDMSYRRVLRAKDTEDLSTSEIATQMGVPYAEVEELLQTARMRLAKAIDDALKGSPS